MNKNYLQPKQPSCLAALSPAASPDTNHSPLTTHHSLKHKSAFTLAETLITLAIVGIVAALTLPTVINNFKRKSLESQFKVVDSMLQQAFKKSVNELGYTDVSEFTISPRDYTPEKYAQLQQEVSQLNEFWLKQFNIIKYDTPRNWYSSGRCNNIWGDRLPGHYWCFYGVYILSNGASITLVSANYGGPNYPGQVTFSFDTNGPYKGPNRLGYDLFTFFSSDTAKICNPAVQNSENQVGCYYYAHRNINPVYKGKDYWDILFQKGSYFQNTSNK